MKKLSFILALIFLSINVFAQKKWLPGVKGYASQGYYKSESEGARVKTRGGSFLPSSYSLREYAPPVGEQEGGTCVGWATAYAGLSILENIKLDRRDDSLKAVNAFSPYFTYILSKFDEDNECSEGLIVEMALNSLQNVGAIRQQEFNSVCIPAESSFGLERILQDSTVALDVNKLIPELKKNRLESFIPISGVEVVQNAKYYLNKKMPVVIAVNMYQSIVDNLVSNVWNGVIDDYPGGHAMCIVGYDDNKFGGAFEIMNSWGKEYGDNGIIWFRYEDFAREVKTAYALSGMEDAPAEINPNNEFNITLSAVGTSSSKLLPINQSDNYYEGMVFSSQNSLSNSYTINYSNDDEKYRLNITSNSSSPYYVYMFSFASQRVILESSFINQMNALDKSNGLIMPSNSYSAYTLSESDLWGKPYCLLVSKKPLEENLITASLKRSYSSLEDFLLVNFNSQLVINKPSVDYLNYDGKIEINTSNEPNDILPILINHQLEERNDDLFGVIDLNTDDYEAEILINETLSNFKHPKSTDPESDLSLEIKLSKTLKGYSLNVTGYDQFDFFEELFSRDVNLFGNEKKDENLFKFSVSGDLKSIPKKLEKELFKNLTKNNISFVFQNE
ncbi:MAG: C1 family peptidase [Algoriphagus sp.]